MEVFQKKLYDKWNFKPKISSIFHFEHVNEVWISHILCVRALLAGLYAGLKFLFEPLATRYLTISRLPLAEAKISGVSPMSSFPLTSAPLKTRQLMVSMSSWFTAIIIFWFIWSSEVLILLLCWELLPNYYQKIYFEEGINNNQLTQELNLIIKVLNHSCYYS